nr:MAG: ORF1 [TTV-like mini virus]
MPPWTYRYRFRRRPQRWRRRRQSYRWRIRRPFQRGLYRRRWVRRRFKRLPFRKRKLRKITVKEWQPKKIVKCKIKGNLCLFACGRMRINHNYTMFSESIVPVGETGGGGWSIMQLTLRALYDEFIHYHNFWTKSNDGLPLVRYQGCVFKFYRSPYTDYIVTAKLCPPFSVTRDDYLNMQPSRQLMNYRKIIVPRLTKHNYKRNYIKKRFPPPNLFQTKWYFQQDILNTPFIVLQTSACSLDEMYQPSDQLSYNITLYSLSTFFENPAYEYEVRQGYWPKKPAATQTFYLYGTENGPEEKDMKWQDLVFLGNTQTYSKGIKLTDSGKGNFDNWGNPFHAAYSHKDARIFYSLKHPSAITSVNQNCDNDITQLHNLYQECRYNPFKDKGTGNTVYFKSTSLIQGTYNTIPTKLDIVVQDYPLWLIFYAWTDWLKKLKPINHIDTEYQFVVKSPYITPQQQWYVFLDWYFVNPKSEDLTDTEKHNWHPRYDFQTESEFYFAQCGPASPKINKSKCIQANCNYKFFLKWGGCPAQMEQITNPADQEKFPTPNTIPQGLKIQDPETPKESMLYSWDERSGFLTKTATKRIKTYLSPEKYFTDYGSLDLPPEIQTQESETSTEEETDPLPEQLNKLKLKQHQLKRRILQLTKKKKLFL